MKVKTTTTMIMKTTRISLIIFTASLVLLSLWLSLLVTSIIRTDKSGAAPNREDVLPEREVSPAKEDANTAKILSEKEKKEQDDCFEMCIIYGPIY